MFRAYRQRQESTQIRLDGALHRLHVGSPRGSHRIPDPAETEPLPTHICTYADADTHIHTNIHTHTHTQTPTLPMVSLYVCLSACLSVCLFLSVSRSVRHQCESTSSSVGLTDSLPHSLADRKDPETGWRFTRSIGGRRSPPLPPAAPAPRTPDDRGKIQSCHRPQRPVRHAPTHLSTMGVWQAALFQCRWQWSSSLPQTLRLKARRPALSLSLHPVETSLSQACGPSSAASLTQQVVGNNSPK
eukprot:GHVU01033544.1.p1 GENE.GHVU01033544.1~~GHVU01033544.1.p1  ORF type:complete len:244 (+),score=3.27 GHVU01033544.1:1273-2004(+)